MKIANVRLKSEGRYVSLVADCKIRRIGKDIIYFKFDKKYKNYLYEDASPFAAALLIPSMKQGEDLIIDGSISRELYDGMHRVMDILLAWNLGFRRIKIMPGTIMKDAGAPPAKVASFFSGGVDSFYTYLKHKNDSSDLITNFIFINGYDIDLQNKELWESTEDNIRQIADEEKIELIKVESNVRQIINPIIEWDYAHGGALAAVGLCLRSGFKKIYIPSTYPKEHQFHWGSHLELDKNWSTESVVFEHDGAEASRVNKVIWQIAKSPVALKYLRVCYKNIKGRYNCGECKKCLRTMINLIAAGKLNECGTLPHAIDLKGLAEFPVKAEGDDIFYKENLVVLKAKNLAVELQKAIELNLKSTVSEHKNFTDRALNKMIYFDHAYLYSSVRNLYLHLRGKKF